MRIRKHLNAIQISWLYFLFILEAKHHRGHGIHSPFVFNFIQNILFDKSTYSDYGILSSIRKGLNKDKTIIPVFDLGAGSSVLNKKNRSVNNLLKISSVNPRYGKLYYRIAKYFQPKCIIELGTSIGLSTLCFSIGSPNSLVISLEGNKELCRFSAALFEKHNAKNIRIIEGDFDSTLPDLLNNEMKAEVVFIDGNHAYEPTLRYFDQFCHHAEEGILIFDDISWSKNMRKAWKEISTDSRAHVCLDLFFVGIVIRRNSITPGNFKIRF